MRENNTFFFDFRYFFYMSVKTSVADPSDLKKTGSRSYLDMFFMFNKINNFVMVFLYQMLTSHDT